MLSQLKYVKIIVNLSLKILFMTALQVVWGPKVSDSQEKVWPLGLEVISPEVRELRRNAQKRAIELLEVIPEWDNKTTEILELLSKYSKDTRQDVRNWNTDWKHPNSIRGDKWYELIYPDSPLRSLLSALDETTLKDFLNSTALGELFYFFHWNQSQRIEDEIRIIIENKFGKKNKKFADIFIIWIKKWIIKWNYAWYLADWKEETNIPTKDIENFIDFHRNSKNS